ncbi:MAG TPA: preprotein translocase subunit SecE [Blastocatellia bacterium]|nr:preprotein translocase subunit SecE [Blastocatellia bacterium]
MSRVTDFSGDEERPREVEREKEAEAGGKSISVPGLGWTKRISTFYQDVKLEMKKTSWPNRSEVWSTTLVVLIAIVFFGFYLWGVDRLVTLGFEFLEKAVR